MLGYALALCLLLLVDYLLDDRSLPSSDSKLTNTIRWCSHPKLKGANQGVSLARKSVSVMPSTSQTSKLHEL